MKSLVLAAGLMASFLLPAHAASISKTYSYFQIGGTTLEEIEGELQRRGPHVESTGARHPGATRMEFSTRITYHERGGLCSVAKARVTVKAEMILPRWNRRRSADGDTRFVWDALSSDIRRHEESHITIAKNHARELEDALTDIFNYRGCDAAQQKAEATRASILAKHDRAQLEFDRIENVNFEKRLLRLMRYRLEQQESGR
ncbi:DUF922 domain-containing protein [Mesorhizobium sp. CAU 1741]|uniref:DUF922 domain-containing Zn-dependent protease n=1 Tax=Mesorhizobium sp. CAU 1741 TaxID=3140366 RepID=UPI00325B2099